MSMNIRAVRFGLWAVLGLSMGGAPIAATTQTVMAQEATAPGIAGTWQGTLTQDNGSPVRLVLKIEAAKTQTPSATLYLVDVPAHKGAKEITFANGEMRSVFGGFNDGDAVLSGRLAPDGRSIAAVWNAAKSFVLERTTSDTAWAIPEEPKPMAAMDLKADPSFEIATITPRTPR